MRGFLQSLIAATLATLVAGCNFLTDYRYYREGIGSDLYGAESLAASASLDAYVGILCHQAGLPQVMNADGTLSCALDNSSSGWALVVQAGMNDIDGRCDGYLAWLDDKRRSNEPFLKQLAATSAATLGILDATSAGVKAITITGIAFGLAANTFTNVNARILSLEQSTVQSVVLDSQQKYRKNNSPSAVQSRPAAIYYLRNYLRICLPFSIETSINNTVTVFHRAGSEALDSENTLFSKQMVITDPRKPFEPPKPRTPKKSDTRFSLAEERLLPGEIEAIQTALCIRAPDSDLGLQGSATRRAIAGYFSGSNGQPEAATVILDPTRVTTLLRAAGEVKKCPATFRSGYEVGAFALPASERANNVKEIQQKFIDIGSPGVTLSGTFDTATRTAIEKLRTDNAIAGSEGIINFPLHKRILGLKKP